MLFLSPNYFGFGGNRRIDPLVELNRFIWNA